MLCDETGAPVRITGTVMDITERKVAEQELRRQALIFESLCEGVVITDLGGRIIDWNASAEKMFGRGKAEALGQTLFKLLHPGQKDTRTAEVLAALESKGRWTGEVDFKRPDGTQCYCESVAAPLRDAEGRTIALHPGAPRHHRAQACSRRGCRWRTGWPRWARWRGRGA